MRKKLKIFKEWLDNGKISLSDIELSYKSWRGHIQKSNCYRTLQRMDKYYKSLFKEDKQNE